MTAMVEKERTFRVEATGATVLPAFPAVGPSDPFDPRPVTTHEGADGLGEVRPAAHTPGCLWLFGWGSIRWPVEVAEAGNYELSLNCTVTERGFSLRMQVAGDSIVAELDPSEPGPYVREGVNFGRRSLGTMSLPAGRSEIELHAAPRVWNSAMLVRSLVLTRVSDKPHLESERQRALTGRGPVDWMKDARYGVMFHWAEASQPRTGRHKPYEEAVTNLDVNALSDALEEMGAGYLIFTFQHASPVCPAPIREWEQVHPGRTTKRDLISDLVAALDRKKIPLVLYFASHIFAKRGLVPKEEFVDIHTTLLSAVGGRYGSMVKGLWLDGFYQCDDTYPGLPYEDLYRACKSGNPDRAVALNSWIYAPVTDWQDYWAGESGLPVAPPADGIVYGLPFQNLFCVEPIWIHDTPQAAIPDPQLTANEVVAAIEAAKGKGSITANLAIYQDGSISPKSLEVMRNVRTRVRG